MEAIKINPLARWQVAFEQVEAMAYDREKAIELKTDELYDMISDDDFLKIEEIIRTACKLKSIDPDNSQKSLKNWIAHEAEFLVDEEHKQIMKFGRY